MGGGRFVVDLRCVCGFPLRAVLSVKLIGSSITDPSLEVPRPLLPVEFRIVQSVVETISELKCLTILNHYPWDVPTHFCQISASTVYVKVLATNLQSGVKVGRALHPCEYCWRVDLLNAIPNKER